MVGKQQEQRMIELTDSELWKKAIDGHPSILSDPRVSTLKNEYGHVPLHWLASNGVKEALDHPDVSKVKNGFDSTPLHYLARNGVKEACLHPDFDKVKNKDDETPKDVWITYHKP